LEGRRQNNLHEVVTNLIRKFVLLAAFAALATATARSQPTLSDAMVNVGPHGLDWSIGTWSCVNRMPSPAADPNTTSILKVTKTGAGTALLNRETAKGFDLSAYSAYMPKTKRWFNPIAFADGSYQIESTTDTGKTTVWSGTYFNAASGTTTRVRDTFVTWLPAKFTDLGESLSSGTWKKQYFITCTKLN
jgi:hypothetical protein